MNKVVSGGCLCGAVRYRAQGPPTSMGLCQCKRCQRQSGSAFLIAIVFPKDAVSIEGNLKTYKAYDDKRVGLYRHFCPECGSPIMITLDRYPAIRSIMGGSFDDNSWLKPSFSLWSSSGQPWLTLPEDVHLHAEYPNDLIS